MRKRTIFILSLVYFGCAQNNLPENLLDEEFIFDSSSNWHVIIDSLENMDNYILATRSLERNSETPIKPYITSSTGQKISLRAIRQSRGGGYIWDCRAHFRIFISPYGNYSCIWNTGQSCNSEQLIKNVKRTTDSIELIDEIHRFYSTNCNLELASQINENELEVWITPIHDNLSICNEVIESTAMAYQKFKNDNSEIDIPLAIVLSPIQDNERMNRIRKKEKNRPLTRVTDAQPPILLKTDFK